MSQHTWVPAEYEDLASAQREVERTLLSLPNAVGVALGHKITAGADTGRRAICVLVVRKIPEAQLTPEQRVPDQVAGIPTDVQEVGELLAGGSWSPAHDSAGGQPVAAAQAVALTRRTRPVTGGLSVGHHAITAGTIATACYDAAAFPGMPTRYYLLSNNHVLANSNQASAGDPILQPGPFDGGDPETDVIAQLNRFVPIAFRSDGDPADPPVNEVDAAIAEGDLADLDRTIYWVGRLRRTITIPEVGMLVSKCGRTTGFTTGEIVNINATVDVRYGAGQVARFAGQIVTGNMSAPGDSGSLIADLDGGAVGLLFAGSSLATVVNPIEAVQRLLEIRIADG